jgi:hypothetical protein
LFFSQFSGLIFVSYFTCLESVGADEEAKDKGKGTI